jgi:hypothetical protein
MTYILALLEKNDPNKDIIEWMLAFSLSNYASIFVHTFGRRNAIPTFNDFSNQLCWMKTNKC